MPSIEDFTGELQKGAKEVTVPKEKVTELSPYWQVSKYNLPHRGSKGSLRYGKLHAHDMGDYYSVHLDRVDPKEHSIGHMIEDAPLLLFVWTGFRDAALATKEVPKDELAQRGARSWMPRLLIGGLLILVGILIAFKPGFAIDIILVACILGLLFLGGVSIWNGLARIKGRKSWFGVVLGIIALAMAVVVFYYPNVALGVLLMALTLWLLGSGLFLIFGHGDKLLFPRGSIAPLVMGAISLILAVILILSPSQGVSIILVLIGLLCMFIGLMQVVSGLVLRRVYKAAGSS